MFSKYPEYFLQTKEWADYWQKANPHRHTFYEFTAEFTPSKKLYCIAYEYPWQLGAKFWYIPKMPAIQGFSDSEDLKMGLYKLLSQVVAKAKLSQVAFIKCDFDDNLSSLLNYIDDQSLLKDLSRILQNTGIRKSPKVLQYLSAMVIEPQLNEHELKTTIDNSQLSLEEFFRLSRSFWLTTNENIRRYTKKSLKQGWVVSTEKDQSNFESFWSVYQSTSYRQRFFTHAKSNLEKLLAEKNSRIIVVSDSEGVPQAVWMGWVSERTLTYLHGGNTPQSFKYYGQYLVHLAALKIVLQEKLSFYDLGKYDEGYGYSNFKKGYRGDIRKFAGPIDIVLEPLSYNIISNLLKVKRLLRP
ncbi:MAG: GNAT family N-acetyltransferase [Patescibacteria group bacterium]